MTLDEAIKINTEVAEMRGKRSTVERREALWLGIEALKCIKTCRIYGGYNSTRPLPGETED